MTIPIIKPKKEKIDRNRGANINGSIEGASVSVIDADWWSVDNQSTDFFIIGMFMTPAKTIIAKKRSAFS